MAIGTRGQIKIEINPDASFSGALRSLDLITNELEQKGFEVVRDINQQIRDVKVRVGGREIEGDEAIARLIRDL